MNCMTVYLQLQSCIINSVALRQTADLNEMPVLQLCELYDELECIVREYSECLIQELARRDELEYDKELKNQFISLFLSLQRKKRAYLSQEKKNKSRSKNQPPIDHASKVVNNGLFYVLLHFYLENLLLHLLLDFGFCCCDFTSRFNTSVECLQGFWIVINNSLSPKCSL